MNGRKLTHFAGRMADFMRGELANDRGKMIYLLYIAVQPASTANAVPVTNVDSSDARNSAAAAISLGSARPR